VPQGIPTNRDVAMTVREYVELPLKFKGVRNAEDKARSALELMGIWEHRDVQISRLSRGQLQRAAIARAIATGARVLLLDEPLANVDIQARAELLDYLNEVKRMATVIMATHDLNLPIALADRILLLNKRVVAFGTPDEVLNEKILKKIYKFVKIVKTEYGIVCATDDYGHH